MQKHKELNDKGECTNKPQLSLKKIRPVKSNEP